MPTDCPFCSRQVPAETIICPHCEQSLRQTRHGPITRPSPWFEQSFLMNVCFAIGILPTGGFSVVLFGIFLDHGFHWRDGYLLLGGGFLSLAALGILGTVYSARKDGGDVTPGRVAFRTIAFAGLFMLIAIAGGVLLTFVQIIAEIIMRLTR